ncbi:N/A [soil metagenome]
MSELIGALRGGTKQHHDNVEVAMQSNQIMDKSLTHEGFLRLLRINYLFMSTLEKEVTKNATWFEGLDLTERIKTPNLVSDLSLYDVELPTADEAYFANWSFPRLLGALYVAEGSSLGGQVIQRTLQANSNLHDIDKTVFYKGYAEQTGPMWKAFMAYLETAPVERNDIPEVVAGAQDAFGIMMQLGERFTLAHA